MATLQEQLAQISTDAEALHQIVHGDPATQVPTEGGDVPSVHKLFVDISAREAANVAQAQADVQTAINAVSAAITVAESAQTAAEGAQTAVSNLQASLDIPTPAVENAGRGMVVGATGGWVLGGTAASANIGTTIGTVPLIGSGDKLPTSMLDAGTGASQLLLLDGDGKLPSVSGENLTDIPKATVFATPLLSITNGGYHRDIAHGLGVAPDMIFGEFECISNSTDVTTGYLPLGALLAIPLGIIDNSGLSVDYDATYVQVAYAPTVTISYKRFNNGGLLTLDNTKFNLRIRAIKF